MTDIETEANDKLDEVIADFEEKLQLTIDYEARAFHSVADERLLIMFEPPNNKVLEKREVIFGDRMLEFMHVVEEEEKMLDKLWRQWTGIQLEMICLAMEVLGPDQIVLEEKHMSANVQEKVNAASQIHGQHKQALEETLDKTAAIEESSKKTTARTLKTLKDQQKAWVAASKNTIQQVANTLQTLSET